MDGMIYHSGSAFNLDGPGSASDHIEIPPTSTIGQILLAGNLDATDPNAAAPQFVSCEFIDDAGVQRTRPLNSAHAFSSTKMVRVDSLLNVYNGEADYILNLFFWPRVF